MLNYKKQILFNSITEIVIQYGSMLLILTFALFQFYRLFFKRKQVGMVQAGINSLRKHKVEQAGEMAILYK